MSLVSRTSLCHSPLLSVVLSDMCVVCRTCCKTPFDDLFVNVGSTYVSIQDGVNGFQHGDIIQGYNCKRYVTSISCVLHLFMLHFCQLFSLDNFVFLPAVNRRP